MRPIFSLLVLVTGCLADSGDEPILIRSNLVPNETGCSFLAQPTSAFISSGSIFVGATQGYLLAPLIESRITALDGQESQRTVFLQGARVDLDLRPVVVEDDAGGITTFEFSDAEKSALKADGATHFQTLFSSPLEPLGYTTGLFEIVPTSVLTAIRQKAGATTDRLTSLIVATVTIFGKLGNDEIEGLAYSYPVTACSNCVLRVVGTCPLPLGYVPRAVINPCNEFQDGLVDCCLDPAGDPVCPATVSTM